jgi:4-hydroxybenzoate polyprenyltransferase
VRRVFGLILRFGLSPLGTLSYTGVLAAMLLTRGANVHQAMFWLPVLIFFGISAYYDISAYAVQRRKGLTSAQVTDAVLERLWPARDERDAR